MGVASAVIEEMPAPTGNLLAEIQGIEASVGMKLVSVVYRITFCSKEVNSAEQLKFSLREGIVLSNVVIVNLSPDNQKWLSYIYYSIVSSPRVQIDDGKSCPLLNNYLNYDNQFDCEISLNAEDTLRYQIIGTFFCQQNAITSVCAHATLCMAINNSKYFSGELLLPEEINKKLGIDHGKNPIKGSLSLKQIKQVLDSLGISYAVHGFFEGATDSEFAEYLYRYIEGGCSSMLLFTTSTEISHIVPIVGHTLNTDLWRPEAEIAYSTRFGDTNYRSASAWVDHFIIHDDNFGMYYSLPTDSFRPMVNEEEEDQAPEDQAPEDQAPEDQVPAPAGPDKSFRAQIAISLLPREVITKASKAEWIAVTLLEAVFQLNLQKQVTDDFWVKQLEVSLEKSKINPFLARTFLCSKQDYVSYTERLISDGVEIAEDAALVIPELPDFFWITEVSIPDLYTANKTKLAELIVKCDVDPSGDLDLNETWIAIRIPGLLLRKSKEGTAELACKSKLTSHYPIYRSRNKAHFFEW
jgi:hypothetical protein